MIPAQSETMARRKQCACNGRSQPRLLTQRNVNRVVDAGIGLGALYVGAGVLGTVAGALKK